MADMFSLNGEDDIILTIWVRNALRWKEQDYLQSQSSVLVRQQRSMLYLTVDQMMNGILAGVKALLKIVFRN